MKSFIAAFVLLCSFTVQANHHHSFKFGSASVVFNNESGNLSDDLGGLATPPGITAEANDTKALVFSYDYFLTSNWAVHLAAGIPPEVELSGAGTGTDLGVVGSAKSIIPGIALMYHTEFSRNVNLYFGLGVNYSTFSDASVSNDYTAKFHGTESSVELKDGFGEIIKFGVEYNLNDTWFLDASTSHYGANMDATITTSGTPMVGDVSRTISSKVNPSIVAVTIGMRL